MENNFAIYKTELGYIKIGYIDNEIVFIKVVSDISDMGVKTELTQKVYAQLSEYFNGKRKSFDFKYTMQGTDFQKKVWSELLKIPYGETKSYKDIAIAIGNHKASRAVGMANNKNPMTIVVPCHRVIGSNGKLVGYFGGLTMKEKLLSIESNNK